MKALAQLMHNGKSTAAAYAEGTAQARPKLPFFATPANMAFFLPFLWVEVKDEESIS